MKYLENLDRYYKHNHWHCWSSLLSRKDHPSYFLIIPKPYFSLVYLITLNISHLITPLDQVNSLPTAIQTRYKSGLHCTNKVENWFILSIILHSWVPLSFLLLIFLCVLWCTVQGQTFLLWFGVLFFILIYQWNERYQLLLLCLLTNKAREHWFLLLSDYLAHSLFTCKYTRWPTALLSNNFPA